MKNWKDKILAYALKNAIEHDGKAVEGAVLSGLFHEGLDRKDVKSVIKDVKQIISEVNALPLQEQEKDFAKLQDEVGKRPEREGMPELEDVPKTGIITRFAPSPSGPMHIGHAATGLPTSIYVKKYGGKFYIRIEDTNPENIDKDAYKMIPEEADWLFGNVTEFFCQSDRMPKYYDYIEKLIEKNSAYICDCNPDEFKELIEKQKPCSCRTLKVKENQERWKKMLNGEYKEGEVVLRFKSDLKLDNPALRDFPLARIVEAEHPRQGKKYRVWPLMNLCVSVDDIELGMTHIIRAKEHIDNAKRQALIFKVFNKKLPKTYFLGRLNFTDLEISCSKTKAKIKQKLFSGWDDIRLPFIAALRKRGYQPLAFVKLAEQRGLSDVDKVISKEDYFQLLDNFNREIIREKAKKLEFSKTKKKGLDKIEVLMPDNKKITGFADIKKQKVKNSDIVYIPDLGYAKLNDDVFWFCHR